MTKTYSVRIAIAVTRALLALAVGCAVLVAVSVSARPEPVPCRDTGVSIPVSASPMCVAPQADRSLVLGSAAAAIAVTWLGSGQVRKRLVRP